MSAELTVSAGAAAAPTVAAVHADRPEGRRGALVAYAVVAVAALAWFGVDRSLGWLAGAINVVFAVYFCRHLAFAISAARWAEADLLAADVDLEGYTPRVAVFVGCKNEELVVDGMIQALLALDYPADRIQLVVVDDGSDDDTGPRLDGWAAREPRVRVLHRPPGAGGGKSGALNEALRTVDAEVVLVFDADHEPDPNARAAWCGTSVTPRSGR